MMRQLVESLRELQELEIVLDESRIVHGNLATDQIDAVQNRIADMRHELPPSLLRRFDGLKRVGAPVVREMHGVCAGCHLGVARGDLNRMLRGDREWVCTNCGRYLLLSE